MALDFESIFKTLKDGVVTLAQSTLKDFVAQATAEGQSILDNLKGDLQRWAQEVEAGELNKSDLQDLILGQEDELKMIALEQAGIAEIEVDKFRSGLVDLIASTITGLI